MIFFTQIMISYDAQIFNGFVPSTFVRFLASCAFIFRYGAAATDAPSNEETPGNLACKQICVICFCVSFIFLMYELRQQTTSQASGAGISSDGSKTLNNPKNCKYFVSWQTRSRNGLQYTCKE